MIVRKLAVPLINEKILLQAEHCYIATACISDAGFDFVRSRIPAKCKIDMVTGLDEPTSPNALQRIYRHYQERISLKIYTRNVLHANVYIFDLPFRKAVAYVGSGSFTLEGMKDQEELFWKVTDAKEIESLLSWFTTYYEFGIPLNEAIIQEYQAIYFELKQREILSRQEKQLAMSLSAINWDSIKFRTLFFKKEDYVVLSTSNAAVGNEEVNRLRLNVQNKLTELQEGVHRQLASIRLFPVQSVAGGISSIALSDYPEQKLRSMWFSYGKSESGFSPGFVSLKAGITPIHFSVRLVADAHPENRRDRESFQFQMQQEDYRVKFFNGVLSLGPGFTIEVAGQKKPIDSFAKEQLLWEWIKTDYEFQFDIIIEKNFSPSDQAISSDHIISTVGKEFSKLAPVLDLMHPGVK